MLEIRLTPVAALLTLSTVVPYVASAQDSRADASVEYNYLHDHTRDTTYTAGWSVGLAWHITSRFALAAEGTTSSLSTQDSETIPASVLKERFRSLQAGPRVAFSSSKVRPYVQFLAGVSRYESQQFEEVHMWFGHTRLSLQPGLGADIAFNSRLALRAGIDLRFASDEETECGGCLPTTVWTKQIRVHTGLAINLSRRD